MRSRLPALGMLAVALFALGACGRTRLGLPGDLENPLADGGLREPSDGGPPPTPGCGNGVIDSAEQCDGPPALSCADVGLGEGVLDCSRSSCLFETGGCSVTPACGDEVRARTSLPPACADVLCVCSGATFGACDATCLRDLECAFTACNAADNFERCVARSCPDLSENANPVARELLACMQGNPLCVRGGSPRRPRCGDGILEGREQCDRGNLGGQTCEAFGLPGGSLRCDPTSCTLDLGGCAVTSAACGDGLRDVTERCDGADLAGESCASLGFAGGALRCDRSCNFDSSGCGLCGDGQRQAGEACDGAQLGGQSCVTSGFPGGALRCASDCSFSFDACTVCGDGQIGSGENCDGMQLGGASCESLGLGTGALGCDPVACHFNTRGCQRGAACGNGVAEENEQCDGADLAGHDCASLGLGRGALACNSATCRYATSRCVRETDPACVGTCADANCGQAIATCESTPGCAEVRTCLDRCHQDGGSGCAISCATTNLGGAGAALVVSDCLADCADACR